MINITNDLITKSNDLTSKTNDLISKTSDLTSKTNDIFAIAVAGLVLSLIALAIQSFALYHKFKGWYKKGMMNYTYIN